MVKQMRMAPLPTEAEVEPELTSVDQLTPAERDRIAARQAASVPAAADEGVKTSAADSGSAGESAGENTGEKAGSGDGSRPGRRLGRPRGPERVKLSVRILKAHDEKLTQAVEQTGDNPQELVDRALKLLFAKLKL
ncbi:hypothetical protein ACIRD3_39380 [Kitasatospora sp. NPDC093550]|uniref:hypothetical protein n=1 Tax=Kitasatospora sp. NPDC093550 TaxID=3364089 RepID=UPI003825FF9C